MVLKNYIFGPICMFACSCLFNKIWLGHDQETSMVLIQNQLRIQFFKRISEHFCYFLRNCCPYLKGKKWHMYPIIA